MKHAKRVGSTVALAGLLTSSMFVGVAGVSANTIDPPGCENNGISLGLLNATTEVGRWMLVGLTTAIAIGVAYWMTREKNRIDLIALGMVLGGALGNILDRTRHGYVVDFADLHFGAWRPFLIFNVGDAAISIAVVILLLRAFVARKDQPKGHEPKETIEHA